MIAGLVLVPVARPVMAAMPSHAPMADETMLGEMASSETAAPETAASVAETMDEMASDMPCCPSKAPTPVGCDKCVFMAACGSVGFPAMSASISHPFPILSDTIALQRNDAWPDGLGHPPPEYPPRSLV